MKGRREHPDPGVNGAMWRATVPTFIRTVVTKLTANQIEALNEAPAEAEFPADFLKGVKAFGYNESTIDGPCEPASPASDAGRC